MINVNVKTDAIVFLEAML